MDEPRRLYRSENDKMLAGVCGGLGEFFGIDPTVVRLAFVVLTFAGGAGLALYVTMWLIVPRQSRIGAGGSDVVRDAADEVRDTVQRGAEQARGAYERWRSERDAGGEQAAEDGSVEQSPATGVAGAGAPLGPDTGDADDAPQSSAAEVGDPPAPDPTAGEGTAGPGAPPPAPGESR